MCLIKLFALSMASIAAATPSIEYGQIGVKVTNTAAQKHASVAHSSQEIKADGGNPLFDPPHLHPERAPFQSERVASKSPEPEPAFWVSEP